MSTPKRANIDTEELPQTIKFRPETLHKIFRELVRARRYYVPYHERNLQWVDDVLWQLILDSLQLEIEVSVYDFKMAVLSYYEMYQQDHTMSSLNLPKETMSMIFELFQSQRGSVVEYLNSYIHSPPNLALEYHPESASVVSHRYRPGSSGTIQPLQSFPSSSIANPEYGAFIQGLREIRAELSQEEYTWAELDMAKYGGLIALFSAYGPEDRIQLVKSGHADKMLGRCRGVPESS